MAASSPFLARVVLRDTARLLLEVNRIGFVPAGEGEPEERSAMDSLIVVAVLQANVTPVFKDPGLQQRYGTLDAPPPDDVRRPIGLRRLAESLDLPLETTRRRVNRLDEQGVLAATPDGVLVGQAAVATDRYAHIAQATWRVLGQFYWRLRELGVLTAPALRQAPPPSPFPLRSAMRFWAHHFLRAVGLLTGHVGDLLSLILILAILRANVDDRRPISVAALAKRLDLPFETVRRHVVRLAAEGRCVRTPEGLTIPPELLDGPEWTQIAQLNIQNLIRFYEVLDEENLLGEWEAAPTVRIVRPTGG